MSLGPFRCASLAGQAADTCLAATNDGTLRYDRRHDRLAFFGGGSAVDSVFFFGMDTLSWSAAYAPTACAQMSETNLDRSLGAWRTGAGGPYPRPTALPPKDMWIPVPSLDEWVLLRRDGLISLGCTSSIELDDSLVAHFSSSSNTWSFSATARGDAAPEVVTALTAFELDPPLQKIVGVGQGGLVLYDPATRTKERVFADFGVSALGYSNELVYFPPDGRHYYFERGTKKVFALELDRTTPLSSRLVEVAYQGNYPSHPEPGFAYDEVHRTIVGAVSSGRVSRFDPQIPAFTETELTVVGAASRHVGTMQSHAIAYDAVNEVFVFLTDVNDGYTTWAYRP